MVPKRTFKTKEEIPAGLLSYCAERDGLWHLDLEDPDDKGRLAEFRENNTALLKQTAEQKRQIDDLMKRFEGIDPDQVRKMADEKRQLEQAQQLKAGEFEKVLAARLQAVKTDLEKQLNVIASERDALNTRLATVQIDQGIVTLATKRGLRPTALTDITARGRSVFKLVNGVPTAIEADGRTVRYGKDGTSPMTLDEWIDSQVTEAPHLFESNAGGGAAGAAAELGRNGQVHLGWHYVRKVVDAKGGLMRIDALGLSISVL